MSYAPATKLSYADASNCATVLTDGYIMITKGFAAGQRMPFADWLIMADGQRIQEEFIPVKPIETVATYPIGTKFKYTSQDGSSLRTAIQVANGVLQVSSTNNGEKDTTKKMYVSYAEWQSTLAISGVPDIIYRDSQSKVEKLLSMRSKTPLSDFAAVKELEDLFSIRNTVSFEKASRWADRASSAHYELSRKIEELGCIDLEDHPKLRMALKGVMRLSKDYRYMKIKADYTKNSFMVKYHTTTKVAVRSRDTNGKQYWSHILTCPKSGCILSNYTVYNILADIHNPERDENGKPILYIRYRGRYY